MTAPLWPAALHHLRRDSEAPALLACSTAIRSACSSPTASWNDIRHWVEDPDGHKVEFSAELGRVPREAGFRTWPHEQRTLNLWGSAWMRN